MKTLILTLVLFLSGIANAQSVSGSEIAAYGISSGYCPVGSIAAYNTSSGLACLSLAALPSDAYVLYYNYYNYQNTWVYSGYTSYSSGWSQNYAAASCTSSFPGCNCIPVGGNSKIGICTR